MIVAMSEYMWSDDEEQPDGHVNDGNASKQSRYCTLNVIQNGQELEVFIVEDLLQIWQSCFHGEEISNIISNGLAKMYCTLTLTTEEEIEIGLGLEYRHDLASENGKAKRGWKGLGLVSRDHEENPGNESLNSAAPI